MTDYTESELAQAWAPSFMPPPRTPPSPGLSHVHSSERCEHEPAGDEIHWLCGMHPVYTNAATARAMSDHIEVKVGWTFLRGDGSSVVIDGVLKRLADGILAMGPYDENTTAGQQIVNAVWDANRTRAVLFAAGLLADVETAVAVEDANAMPGEPGDVSSEPSIDALLFETMAPLLGDPVFVLSMLMHGIPEAVEHDAEIEHSIGRPPKLRLVFGDHEYRVTISRTLGGDRDGGADS